MAASGGHWKSGTFTPAGGVAKGDRSKAATRARRELGDIWDAPSGFGQRGLSDREKRKYKGKSDYINRNLSRRISVIVGSERKRGVSAYYDE